MLFLGLPETAFAFGRVLFLNLALAVRLHVVERMLGLGFLVPLGILFTFMLAHGCRRRTGDVAGKCGFVGPVGGVANGYVSTRC